MHLNETTSRADLEICAIDADINLDAVSAATDAELLAMLMAWVEAGDECGL